MILVGFCDSMDKIVLDSNKVYRKLVFETPAFLDYFLQATPSVKPPNFQLKYWLSPSF